MLVSGAPIPVSVTAWVAGLALSVSVRVALRVPVPPGVNVISTPQLVPGRIVGGLPTQPEVTPARAKSPESVPVSAAPLRSSVAVPGLDTVSTS